MCLTFHWKEYSVSLRYFQTIQLYWNISLLYRLLIKTYDFRDIEQNEVERTLLASLLSWLNDSNYLYAPSKQVFTTLLDSLGSVCLKCYYSSFKINFLSKLIDRRNKMWRNKYVYIGNGYKSFKNHWIFSSAFISF